jgi:hypothetical protein
MKCPECGEEIDEVIVVSTCYQTATLDGNHTVDYSSPEVEETQRILCPECSDEITEKVNEG